MSALAVARDLVAGALALAPGDIPDDALIGTVPGWDSLGHVRVLLALEGRLGRPLRAGEVAALRGLADIARLLAAA